MMIKHVRDLEIGDRVVLKDDPYVDFNSDLPDIITILDIHNSDCDGVSLIDFAEDGIVAFPQWHRVLVED